MNPNIQIALQDKKECPIEIMRAISREGTLTGSKVFGGFNVNTSDVDYILPPNFSFTFADIVQYGCYEGGSGRNADFQSIYVKRKDIFYNLLFIEDEETFYKWKTTTQILKNLVHEYPTIREKIKQKSKRVATFEWLKELLDEEPEIYYPKINDSFDFDDDVPF